MKENFMEIMKDVATTVLILICLLFVLAICFYDKISLSKVVPETEEYNLTNKMKEELNSNELEDAKEVVVSYYLDSKDLNKYEESKDYDKGKSNPFSAPIITSDDINNNSSSNTTTNNNSTGFYPNYGIK